MKAAVLVRKGDPSKAFEIREVPNPTIKAGEVLVKVEGFGLNFADVMARQGLYADAPPMPSVLGYDVVGRVKEVAPDITHVKVGDRVTAMTRFGGYAEYVAAIGMAVARIADDVPVGEATALTTQYCTAYFAAADVINLHAGDRVLIHSAAGGVGTALLQYAKHMGCEIFATVGSDAKAALVKAAGAHHAINYVTQDFAQEVARITGGKGLDVIWDAVGGSYVKKGFKALAPGGRIVCYGAADISDKNIFGKIGTLLGFGIYHPIEFMNSSKALIGVNMLRIADNNPDRLKRCLDNVVKLYEQGVFKPQVGQVFPVSQIGEAHAFLESRRSTGKITVTW
jgi:NADPH2:quinone reductase